MANNIDLNELDLEERELLDRFRQHPFFLKSEQISLEALTLALLQRRFLSILFTPLYDLAIDCLVDERGINVARKLL